MYGHAPHSAHPTRVIDSYGVYHEPPRYNVNFHEPLNDRYVERCAGTEYHDTHITYTDPLRAERIPYNDEDGFVPQRAQLARAGVVVNASGSSAVVRTSTAQNNTHCVVQNNSHTAHNGNGAQNTANAQPNAQPSEEEGEQSFCCGCKGKRKTNASSGSTSTSIWAVWCRPTILLLMLVLVASVFVLASGIMLYYHCMYQLHVSVFFNYS